MVKFKPSLLLLLIGINESILEEEGVGNEKTSEEFVINLSEHLRDCKRVLNDRGSFFLNLGDTFYNGNLQNVPHRVILKLQEQGWILRNTIIWSKD